MLSMRVVKKPIEVEAWKINKNDILFPNLYKPPEWVLEAWAMFDLAHINGRWYVRTLEGDMTANEGDYIIKGIAGELYPCKAEIFNDTYEVI